MESKLHIQLEEVNQRKKELEILIRQKLIDSELDNFKKYIGKCFKVLVCEDEDVTWNYEYYQVKDVVIDSIKLDYDNKPTCEFICKSMLKDQYNRVIFQEDEVYLYNLVDEITNEEFNSKLEELILEIRI